MLPREAWRVAVDALWSNKLRAILTTLGVVIGSACIVLVVTVAVTGRRAARSVSPPTNWRPLPFQIKIRSETACGLGRSTLPWWAFFGSAWEPSDFPRYNGIPCWCLFL